MDNLVHYLVHLVGSFPLKYASEGYIIKRALSAHLTYGEETIRAAIVVALTRGVLEYQGRGLSSTDGTPWLGVPEE